MNSVLVSKEFLRDYLISCVPSKLSNETLKLMERATPGCTHAIFNASHNIQDKSNFPKACLDKTVARCTFADRLAKDVGANLKDIAFKETTFVQRDGQSLEAKVVDWTKWGMYTLEPAEEWPKTSVTHWLGLSADLDPPIQETASLDIQKNWVSSQAMLSHGRWHSNVVDLFSATDKKQIMDSERTINEELAKLAAAAAAKLRAEKLDTDSDDEKENTENKKPAPNVTAPTAKKRKTVG